MVSKLASVFHYDKTYTKFENVITMADTRRLIFDLNGILIDSYIIFRVIEFGREECSVCDDGSDISSSQNCAVFNLCVYHRWLYVAFLHIRSAWSWIEVSTSHILTRVYQGDIPPNTCLCKLLQQALVLLVSFDDLRT